MAHHDHDHDRCLELFEKLSEYLDDELSAPDCERIEQHIRDCCHCYICYETLKRTVDLCRSTREDPVPQTLASRLDQLIKDLSRV